MSEEDQRLLPCPFCGGEVTMEYEPIVSYAVNCCAGISLQIHEALEERGLRFEDGYRWIDNRTGYPEKAKAVCRERVAEIWNARTPTKEPNA